MKLAFVIPGTPPSVNHAYKHTRAGQHYITAEALRFRRDVAIVVAGRKLDAKEYAVAVRLFLGKGVRLDSDNSLKVLFDALAKCGAIVSDARIKEHSVVVGRDWVHPRTEVEIESIDDVRELEAALP